MAQLLASSVAPPKKMAARVSAPTGKPRVGAGCAASIAWPQNGHAESWRRTCRAHPGQGANMRASVSCARLGENGEGDCSTRVTKTAGDPVSKLLA